MKILKIFVAFLMISTAAHAKSDLDKPVSAYANQVKACRQDWDVACDSYKRACGNWTQEQLGKRYHVNWGPNETHPEGRQGYTPRFAIRKNTMF
jgi:hypothetical protein